MKGQAKRFLNHNGKMFDVDLKKKKPDEHIGFFDLWRYASAGERLATAGGAALAALASCALVAAVVIYGELTSLFVQRHSAAPSTPHAHLLRLFGGGEILPAGNRSAHMDALVRDSVAFGAASVAIMLVQMAAAAAAVTLANWAAARMVTRLRLKLLRSVICQEMAFFDTNTTMNFASTLTEDMEKLRAGVGEHVAMTAYLGGTVVCGAALALAYGWQLTLAGLSVVPVALLVAAVVAKYQTKCSSEEVTAYGAAGRVVEEALSNIRTVRAFGGEEVEAERYAAALGGAAPAARARGLWAGAGAGLGWLLTYSLNAVVFAYGAALCVRDMALPPELQEYHPGIMVTVLFCTFMAAQNITMCHPHLEVFSAARGAAKSLFRLLERESSIDALRERGAKPAAFRGDISFDNVHFAYPSRADVKVLRGLSLAVRAGETVALVGASGCGKSTLLQLLQRMYAPDGGAISVDGHRLPDLDLHHFRSSIGVVGQEPVLFSGTIRENIALGAGDVSEAELVAAAQTAHAHGFVSQLAQGYDTVLGEGGAQLSGGQRQRLAIARAVLRRPALLLLDEPTSALDPAAERQVQAALDAAGRGRTTLVVSHRLAAVARASRIVCLEAGAVAEAGSHDELLARRGLYWRLVQADMTTRSIAASAPAAPEPAAPFQRSSSRRSTSSHRGSMHARLGSATSAHVAAVAAPDLPPELLPEESPEEESEAGVSSLQLLRLHRPERALVLGGGLASFTVGATMPAFAFLFSKLYGMFSWSDGDDILAQSQLYAGLFAGVAALCGAVTFLQTWLFNLAGARLTDRLRRLTFSNYLRQEQGWFDEPANSVGALCARLAADCAAVQGATGTRLGTVLQGISTMVLGVGLAALYSWKMTLVSLLSVPCIIGGICLEGYVSKRAALGERRALERAARAATEALLHVRTVQSLGVEREFLARYAAALAAAERGAAAARRARGLAYGLCLCAPTLGYAVSLAYGGYLVAREGLAYESAILVSEALVYGAWMLAEALSFAPNFAAARRSGARILAALARPPGIVSEPSARDEPDWVAAGEVSFSEVEFSYPRRPAAAVLRGLSLRLEAGRTLALVGRSGCGKSTLVQLLQRCYDPRSGLVELDGRDVRRALPLRRLRAALGLVQQEPALFARSIRDNIAYGDNARDVPLAEVVRAAEQANVHAFIASLPLGYETVLGGGGAALSGGQKQRVAIARALVRQPRVLLLDEATSALDAASERAVQAALDAAARGRTTLVIAHRLATVRHAHTICVIDQGVVAESGSHEELVRRRGLYWELLQQQAPAPDAAADAAR